MAGLTREQLLALPATTDVATAGRALGLGRSKAYELAAAGKFPVRVLRLGKHRRVPTADLLTLLGIEEETSASGGRVIAQAVQTA